MKLVNKKPKIAVVGAGASGIAASYYALKKGYEVDLIESSAFTGGRIGSDKMGNRWIDFGGKNIGYAYKLFREFVADQGQFNYEYFGVNTSKVVEGKLLTINREKNFKSLLNLLKLANPIDLIKLFYLVKRIKKNPAEGFLGHSFYNMLADRFDHKPLSKYFSSKCCDNLIRSMTVRMNGAEAEECFLGNFGSNLRIAFDKYDQIEEGIHSVIHAFSSKVNLKTNTKVVDLVIENQEVKGIKILNQDNKEESLYYDRIIISTPAYITSNILRSNIPEACEYLDRIKYNPVTVMIVKYQNPVFDSNIRAMVFDKQQILSNAGAYGAKDLDLVRYTFSGKAAQESINNSTSQEFLIKIINDLMPDQFNIKDNKIIDCVHRYFEKGLCSYSQYHYKNLKQLQRYSFLFKNLALSGDYVCGASIEACFQSSKAAVESII